MEKFALAVSRFRRYKFDECIVLSDEILKSNPNDYVIIKQINKQTHNNKIKQFKIQNFLLFTLKNKIKGSSVAKNPRNTQKAIHRRHRLRRRSNKRNTPRRTCNFKRRETWNINTKSRNFFWKGK